MSVEERNDKTDEIGNCVGGLHAQQRDRCESELKDKIYNIGLLRQLSNK